MCRKGSYLKVAVFIFHISESDPRNWMKPCMLVSHVESGAHAKAERTAKFNGAFVENRALKVGYVTVL